MKRSRLMGFLAVFSAVCLSVGMVSCSPGAAASGSASASASEAVSQAAAPAQEGTRYKVKEGEQVKVGWINPTMSNGFYSVLAQSAKAEAEALGWKFSYIDSGFDTSKELAAFEDYIAQDVDMIFVDVVDAAGVVAATKLAESAGIPVIEVDYGGNPESRALTTVMIDNKGLGILGGQNAGTKFGVDEEVIVLQLSGQKGNVEESTRKTGFWAGLMQSRIKELENVDVDIEELYAYAQELAQTLIDKGTWHDERSNVTVAIETYGEFSESVGMSCTEDMVTSVPQGNLLISSNDAMAQGALKAIKNNGLLDQIMICPVADGMKSTLKLIKEGEIASCGMNDPSAVAKRAIEIGKQILVDGVDVGTIARTDRVTSILVTSENVDKVYDPDSEF